MGGGEEIAFSPDGKTVYFALREAGRIEAKSTNLDIFASPADGGTPPTNLTDANDGTDNLPVVSPDGKTLAYFAMARPTYEADRQVLQLRDLATGQTRALTQAWDRSVGSIEWARDGKSILVTAEDTLEQPVFRVDAPDRQGHAADPRRPLRERPSASERRRDRDDEQHQGARRNLPAQPQRQGEAADRHQSRTARGARPGAVRQVQLHRRQR